MWSNKLIEWENGLYQIYPDNIKNNFFYETYKCSYDNKYIDKFIETNKFNNINEDYSSFIEYINTSDNKYFTSFYNINKTAILLIPMPRKNKSFTTMKHFIDSSSKIQQKLFWIEASRLIKQMLEENEYIYVSTHGLGVYYFHLRIELKPKYYLTNEFK